MGWVLGPGWFDTVLRRLRTGSPRAGAGIGGCAEDGRVSDPPLRKIGRGRRGSAWVGWVVGGRGEELEGGRAGPAGRLGVGALWFDTGPSASSGQDFGGRRDDRGVVGALVGVLSWRWGTTGRRDSSGDLGMTGGRGRGGPMGGLSWRWGMTGRRDSSGDLGMTGGSECSCGCSELAMGHDRKARFLGGPRNDRGGAGGGLSWRWGTTGRRDSSGDLGMTAGRGCSRGCSELAMGHDRKSRFLGGPRNDRGGAGGVVRWAV